MTDKDPEILVGFRVFIWESDRKDKFEGEVK